MNNKKKLFIIIIISIILLFSIFIFALFNKEIKNNDNNLNSLNSGVFNIAYNDQLVDIVIKFPEKIDRENEINVILAFHGTTKDDSLKITAAENMINIMKDIINENNYIIASVAYSQHDSLLGDNMDEPTSALLWFKNEAEEFFDINIGKLFLVGHSMGGYVVTRLNTIYETDGVIANAPGPLDLSYRCKQEELIIKKKNRDSFCSRIKDVFGSVLENPQPYIDRSLISFANNYKSPIIFVQGNGDTNIQLDGMELLKESLDNCVDCEEYSFIYINGNHGALFQTQEGKNLTLDFLETGILPPSTPIITNPPEDPSLDFINLNINFYCYEFESHPDLDCDMNQIQISDYLITVNDIWSQAGIQWKLNSFQERYISSQEFTLTGNESKFQMQQKLINIAPESNRENKIWNVILINSFPKPLINAGGFYFPPKGVAYFVENKEAKILAHELGHSLSLWDFNDQENSLFPTNLMGKGLKNTDYLKITLNPDQINFVKNQALIGPATGDEMRGENNYR